MAKNVVGLENDNVLSTDYTYDISLGKIQSEINANQVEVNESQASFNTDVQNALGGKLDNSYLKQWIDNSIVLSLKIINIACDSSSGATITITVTGGYCDIQMLVFTRYGITCLYASASDSANLNAVNTTTLMGNAGFSASVSGANLIIKTSTWTNFYALAYTHTTAKMTWTYS